MYGVTSFKSALLDSPSTKQGLLRSTDERGRDPAAGLESGEFTRSALLCETTVRLGGSVDFRAGQDDRGRHVHKLGTRPRPIARYRNTDARLPARLPSRRTLLASTAMLLAARAAGARTLAGGTGMPWRRFAGDPPQAVKPGPWVFYTPEEGAAVDALVDRLIPPDPETPGGKDCGCAVFIDRQLAGAYGSA